MKKTLFAMVSLAMLLVTSCSKDDLQSVDNKADESQLTTFVATIGDTDGSRTALGTDGKTVNWVEGDEIAVNGETFTAEEGGKASVNFTSSSTVESPYHAFYPVSIAVEEAAGTLPATQTGEASGLPMYATSDTKSLTFHNICAVLKIQVPAYVNGATSIEVSSGQRMNGAFTVTGNVAMMVETESEADRTITVTPSSGTFSTDDEVYIAVPAAEYTDLKVKFLNGGDATWNKTIACTLSASKIYPINMTPAGVCFTAQKANTAISFTGADSLQYSKNGGSWTDYSTANDPITLEEVGGTVCFRAKDGGNNNFKYIDTSGQYSLPKYHKFAISSEGEATVSGNIMYLLSQTPATALDATNNVYAFNSLFNGCAGLTDASGLLLPATALAKECYNSMFAGCTGLKTAPTLPAQTLAPSCYYYMFNGCTSLTAAPTLPAETLTENCYAMMFSGCASLTTAPTLSAKTLTPYCYQMMFYQCSKLSSVTILATTTAYCSLNSWIWEADTDASVTNPTVYVASGMVDTVRDVVPEKWKAGVQVKP